METRNNSMHIASWYKCKIRFSLAIIFFLFGIVTTPACTKLVEVGEPVTSINQENVFADDLAATSVVNGFYLAISNVGEFSGLSGIAIYTGLSSDEFGLYNDITNATLEAYYKNQLISNITQTIGGTQWNNYYQAIYRINAALEGLTMATELTSTVKTELMGECFFLRSFYYFYLVNFFGDVPLVLDTDWKKNALVTRSSQELVYQQIIADLQEAQSLLSAVYLDGRLSPYASSSVQRLRPVKATATALLARVYLYHGDNQLAEQLSTQVITDDKYGLVGLDNVFLTSSMEAIWQVQRTGSGGWNTEEARVFILPATGPNSSRPVFLSDFLLNSFEPADERMANWVGSVTTSASETFYYPFKYKSNSSSASLTEYFTVFRLAEQFLIRAEARARQNELSAAIDDLDEIRNRAGLPLIADTDPGITQQNLIDTILHERRIELFSEWGHRWLDLKRTNKVDAVMQLVTPAKADGDAWQTYQQWYPVPYRELNYNPNMEQTPGYGL